MILHFIEPGLTQHKEASSWVYEKQVVSLGKFVPLDLQTLRRVTRLTEMLWINI